MHNYISTVASVENYVDINVFKIYFWVLLIGGQWIKKLLRVALF